MSAAAQSPSEGAAVAQKTAGPPRTPKVRRLGARARAERREAVVLVLPALLPIIIFSVIPLASGVALGFTDATLARNAETTFIGLGNFIGFDLRFFDLSAFIRICILCP